METANPARRSERSASSADDSTLLRQFAAHGSEDAFAEVVGRHVNLVYSVALRQVGGDTHLAEDVAQQVFVALARKAADVATRSSLSGWLYRGTHFAASDAVRMERRRRRREQEKHTMQEFLSPTSGAGEIEWDRVRPAIDAAIAELDERDRDAVSLRYFDGCSFAEVGARLRLTENAARMRVERALDKLHAALGRRGVRSTAAAVGLALGGQAATAAPAMFASSVAKFAVAQMATGAGSATVSSASLITAVGAKAFAGASLGVALIAVGLVFVQQHRLRETDEARVAVEQQRQDLEVRLTDLSTRLSQSERRAAEAEKDSGELLKAVDELRIRQTNRAPGAGGVKTVVQLTDEEERLANERTYQQELARRRAEDARLRAALDIEIRQLSAAEQFNRLIALAEQYLARADLRLAISYYNRAMAIKPADLPVTDQVRLLQAALAAQNDTVDVHLKSDGWTWVSITGVRTPAKFNDIVVKLLPGDYEILGRRKGYRDVVLSLRVRRGEPPLVVTIVCTVSTDSK